MGKQLTLLFILIFFNMWSQSLDSLLIHAAGCSNDTARAALFYNKGYASRLTNTHFSYCCARYCEAYAERADAPYYRAKAATLLGILFYRKQDYKKAMFYHREAMEWSRLAKDSSGLIKSLINMANVTSDLKWFRNAELFYLQALQLSTDSKSEALIRKIYLNLGVLHQQRGNNIKLAEYYYLKALEQSKAKNDFEVQSAALNNLADLAIEQKETEKAEVYAEQALVLKDMMDLKPERADSYLNLARLYLNSKNTDKAALYLDSAQQLIEKYDYEEAKAEFLELKAQEAEQMKKFESANFYNKLLLHMRDSVSKLKNEVVFDENFRASIPQQEASYSYLIWICLFLLAPILIFFVRTGYNEQKR